jgi:hypothetical protein
MSLNVILSNADTGDSYSANITHNLNRMAEAAGIYRHLWRPEELGIVYARELIEPLTEGLNRMKADPVYYSQFNAPNGWGLYQHFVPWVERYLDACKALPDATVEVYR